MLKPDLFFVAKSFGRRTLKNLDAILLLEMQKQKGLFLSTLLVLSLAIGGATFVVAGSSSRSLGLSDAFVGAGSFAICLLPLIASLFGAAAAMGVRKKEQEQILPASPAVRVFGAYLTGLFYFATVLLAVVSFMASAQVYDLIVLWLGPFMNSVPSILFQMIYLHFLSFGLVYLFGLPILGGGLAIVLAFVQAFFVGVLNVSYQIMGTFPVTHQEFPFSGLAASCIGNATLIFVASRKIERDFPIRFKIGSLLAIAVLTGTVLLGLEISIMERHLHAAFEGSGYTFWQWFWILVARDH